MRDPGNEAKRLAALRRYRIVDTPSDPRFDELALLAAAVCDAPIAFIGCVDRERIWLKARCGVDAAQIPPDWIPVTDVRGLSVIPDLAADPHLSRLPSVSGESHWRAIATMPIHSDDGQDIGLLAIADTRRRRFNDQQRSAIEILARQAEALFELHRLRAENARLWAYDEAHKPNGQSAMTPDDAGPAEAAAPEISFATAELNDAVVRRRILVVDDVEAAATMLGRVLEAMGHETRIAHDGPKALAIAKEYHPDVILLDLGMPGMSGFVVARLLRAQAGLEDITLIAVTGHGRDEDRRQALEAGFDHHLLKPVSAEHMRVLLEQLPVRASASSVAS